MKHVGIASDPITLPAALYEMVTLKPSAPNPLHFHFQMMMTRRKETRSQIINWGQMILIKRMKRISEYDVNILCDFYLHLF